MKASIEVSSRSEAELIKSGLTDKVTRALVCVLGSLVTLSADERRLVLTFVQERLPKE